MKQLIYRPAHQTIEDLVPYQTGKPIEELAREMGLERIVKLASNENPRGPSPLAVEAATRAVAGMNRYPDGGGYHLRNALAERHNVAPELIVLGNGSNEILELLAQLLLGEGDRTLYAWPAFIVYRLATLAHGARGIEVPLDADLRHDLNNMADAVDDSVRMVFVANPNNPTGTYVGRDELEGFLDRLPDRVLPILDEAYCDYALHLEDYPDGIELLKEGRQVVVLRTFSKAHGLAGLRVGYAIVPEPLAELLNRVRQPFNVNSAAQEAALGSLGDEAYTEESIRINGEEMVRLEGALADLGLSTVPSAANFLLMDLAGRNGADVYQGLLERGVIVRQMAPYGMPGHLRVTIGMPEENDFFLDALEDVLNGEGM